MKMHLQWLVFVQFTAFLHDFYRPLSCESKVDSLINICWNRDELPVRYILLISVALVLLTSVLFGRICSALGELAGRGAAGNASPLTT